MRRWRGLACGLVWLGACGAPPFEAGVALDAVSPWEHAAVIGGRRTLPEDFPDTGAVRAHEALCSGTLIAPDVVLTAAHCHPQGGVGRGLFFDISKDLRESRPAHRHGVLEVAVHPGWRGHEVNLDAAEAHCGPAPGLLWVRRWLRCLSDLPAEVREQVGMDATERSTGHDLALLFLLRPHGGATPATVWRGGGALEGRDIEVVGYGDTSGRRRRVAVGESRAARMRITAVGPTKFRAQAGSTQSCFGDSGGPAYLEDGARRLVVGVASHLYSETPLLESAACSAGVVYQRVDTELDWIDGEMRRACEAGLRDAESCATWPDTLRD